MTNGSYRIPDAEMKHGEKKTLISGITVANVFFWKTPLKPGRNVIKVDDGHGHSDSMIIYQTPTDTAVPECAGPGFAQFQS